MIAQAREIDSNNTELSVRSRAEARGEDVHWGHAFSRERYYRSGFGYEDYAPAYCVGYVGYSQYGGEFEDGRG